MNIKKEVSIKKVRQDAEELFGSFYCSEAVMSSIKSNFELDVPDQVIAMASGFPVGIGGAKCVCGAVSGGVLTLGLFFGRTEPNDPKVTKLMELTKELHDWFKEENGKHTLCCRILTREFNMKEKEHKAQCTRFTGMIAEKTAEIIVRELGLKNIDAE